MTKQSHIYMSIISFQKWVHCTCNLHAHTCTCFVNACILRTCIMCVPVSSECLHGLQVNPVCTPVTWNRDRRMAWNRDRRMAYMANMCYS